MNLPTKPANLDRGALTTLLCLFVAYKQFAYGGYLSAIFAMLAAALAFKPSREAVYDRLGYELNERVQKSLVTGLLVGTLLSLVPNMLEHEEHEAQKAAQLAAEVKRKSEERLDAHLRDNREAVIGAIRAQLNRGDIAGAQLELAKYSAGNPALVELRVEAEVLDIRAKLKALPPGSLEQKHALYQRLAALLPGDQEAVEMATKLGHAVVEKKQADEQERQAAAVRAAKEEAIKRQFSPWDGSHRAVTEAIKDRMNDPDSFVHDETRYSQTKTGGLTVITKFRGKNKFGGVVRNTAIAEVDEAGRVLSISILP